MIEKLPYGIHVDIKNLVTVTKIAYGLIHTYEIFATDNEVHEKYMAKILEHEEKMMFRKPKNSLIPNPDDIRDALFNFFKKLRPK